MKNIKKYSLFLLENLIPKNLRNRNLLFHSTLFNNFINIIKTNIIRETTDYDYGVATSRDKDFNFGFINNGEDVQRGAGEIQFILDKNKLKHNYKIKAFDWDKWKLSGNINYKQSEDKVNTSIKNIDKYIVGIYVNKDDVIIKNDKNEELKVNIIEYLLNWDFFMEKYKKYNWVIFDKQWRIVVL